MMKKYFIIASALAMLLLASCKPSTSKSIEIRGSIDGIAVDSLYLYEVYSEHYNFVIPIGAFAVAEDGTFAYSNDTLLPMLYYISMVGAQGPSMADAQGSYIFLSQGVNKLELNLSDGNALNAEVTNTEIDKIYRDFKAEEQVKKNRPLLDSLDAIFYAARDRGDTLEMKRIKEESLPYYDQASQQVRVWKDSLLALSGKSLFDLYLYYTEVFQTISLNTLADIEAVRLKLKEFDPEARQSGYVALINASLDQQEQSAIGQVAPDVTGETEEGQELRLSDLRGQLVLVDFWSSGCGWCRAEMPNLIQAYQKYQEQGFTILSVSSDTVRDAWLKAIEKDGTGIWHHIILTEEQRQKYFKAYNITAIPEILLVDAEGHILAKDLRGDAIEAAIVEHLDDK